MTPSEIHIGSRLELIPIQEGEETTDPPMISRLEALEADGGVIVLAPIVDDHVVPFHPEDILQVIYERNGERYGFKTMIRDRYREGDIRFLSLWPFTEPESVQRRGFYRLSHVQPCHWRRIPDPEGPYRRSPDPALFPWHDTLTRNIGGGGVGLLFENTPEMGMYIEGVLEAECEIRFQGRVVRVIPMDPESAYRYEAGISFTDISNRDRERLIRLIYEIQRKQLSKGWSGA